MRYVRFLLGSVVLSIAVIGSAQGALAYSIELKDGKVAANGKVPRKYLFSWIAKNLTKYDVAVVDDFPGEAIDLSGTDLKPREFLSRLQLVQEFDLFQGKSPEGRGFLLNPGPLDSGEVQVYPRLGKWILRAKKATVEEVVETFRLATGIKIQTPVVGSRLVTFETERTEVDLLGKNLAGFLDTLDPNPSGDRPSRVSSDKRKIVTESWPLTFVHGDLITIGTDGAFTNPAGTSDTAEKIATVMNAIYGAGTVTPSGRNLVITGEENTVYAVKAALAKWIDIPFDQVRLDLWVYQGSERKHNESELSDRMELISAGIKLAKLVENALADDLEKFIIQDEFADLTSMQSVVYRYFGMYGLLDPNVRSSVYDSGDMPPHPLELIRQERNRHRPFIDQLIYLTLSKRPCFQQRLNHFVSRPDSRTVRALQQAISDIDRSLSKLPSEPRRGNRLTQREVAVRLRDLASKLLTNAQSAYTSLGVVIETGNTAIDLNSVVDVMKAYRNCDVSVPAEMRTDPERLATIASNSDALIKTATDAISRDMRMTVIEPLSAWIQSVTEPDAGGRPLLVLNGHTSITVTSTRPAATAATTVSHLPYTPPTTVNGDVIDGIVTGLTGANPFNSAGLLQVLKTLSGVTPPQTTYNQIAAGLTMSVRPTVLPGGRSARLLIEATSAVDVNKDRGDSFQDNQTAGGPIDRIKSQHISTDVQVNTFDLFELASFSLSNTGPGDRRWSIPILDGLPFLGGMFRGPRGTLSTVHRSLVIVHTTIMPKTLEVARRYDSR